MPKARKSPDKPGRRRRGEKGKGRGSRGEGVVAQVGDAGFHGTLSCGSERVNKRGKQALLGDTRFHLPGKKALHDGLLDTMARGS